MYYNLAEERFMVKLNINKILFKTANFSGYVLAILMLFYFISGYGQTKGIIDPVFAKTMHEKWLPLPTAIFFVLHCFLYLKFRCQRWIKQEKWLNAYIAILSLVVFGFLFYLYFIG